MITVKHQQLRRCDLVVVSGRIDSATVGELASALDAATNENRFKLVVSMAEVNYISSAGLRKLVDTLKTCRRFNRGNLLLAELAPRVRETLELAGLISLFTVYETETEAVGSF